ncbi:aminotransferase class I/II-fold pyridoxal phosphate-dependent enzyme [Paenalkalicoccus suaedae]|uniref:aminotransferase class I/II-fold pyridoxal phosphate-dependent enzyme n=1 Tax=Paenalkalicoccus suaedae TaxID=2592382 RepID=UPI00158BA283|nr:aminotransferase class V-fold PLP-dependent enzyme [Paenalkalicoccus suaedae]
MKQQTPLFDRLLAHRSIEKGSFHVPGHKNGSVFHEVATSVYKEILSIDQTEVEGLDDLHDPSEVIQEAQQLAATLYGVEDTYFLVGGSTVGNLAMMLTATKRGDTILLQRNSHQSLFHAAELAGVRTILLAPEYEETNRLTLGVSVNTLQEAITAYPEAVAIFLTNPSYEGYGQDLSEHVAIAKQANMLTCIDEAHGAHLLKSNEKHFPTSAIQAGADMVVQSAHKTLPAMTMTAFLHLQSSRIDRREVQRALRMVQSSSPSYPLLASLDLARAYIAEWTEQDWGTLATELRAQREHLPATPAHIGGYVQDPLKLAIRGPGYQLKKQLEHAGWHPELATPDYLLLTLPLRLPVDKAWQEPLHKLRGETTITARLIQQQPTLSELYLVDGPSETVSYQNTVGRIAKETVTPYPPGIPLIREGERITEAQLHEWQRLIKEGASFQTGTHWITEGFLVKQEGE